MIHGGPESALWRSIDAGKTWTKVGGGFPTGRPGPHRPQLRALQSQHHLRAGGRAGRARRHCTAPPTTASPGRGATAATQQGQYYAKVMVDPANPDRVYIMNMQHHGVRRRRPHPSQRCGTRNKHVDNHEIWVDPQEQQPLPGRLRRRHLRELRPRRHVDLQGEPAHRADVRRGGERGRAVLLRLRRHAGQQQLRLSGAHQELTAI